MSTLFKSLLSFSLATLIIACGAEPVDPQPFTPPAETVGPTYHQDVAPILAARCTGCHQDGSVAPFRLDDYDMASDMATVALAAIDSGSMPPWMPDPDCRELKHERLMGEGEADVIRAWIAAGTPEGTPVDGVQAAVTTPDFEPTHVGRLDVGYVPTDAAPDDYRCFVLPIELDRDRYMTASRVVPDARGLVHHVLVYALDESAREAIMEADAAEEGPGYTCFGAPFPGTDGLANGSVSTLDDVASGRFSMPNQIGAWVPGAEPWLAEPGMARRIREGSLVVMQVHYNLLAASPEPDATTFEMVLTDEEPEILTRTRPLPIFDFEIVPGDPAGKATREFVNYGSTPIVIAGAAAHMHLLGSRFDVEVIRESGDEQCLLRIPEWDFQWQQFYSLPIDDYVTVNPGDRVRLTCTYDNSAANQPVVNGDQLEPTTVTWGEGTLDEMCLLYLDLITPFEPAPPADAAACAGAEDCIADCGDTPSLSCLTTCEQASMRCHACSLMSLFDCGLPCAAHALPMQDCLQGCFMTTSTLGGNFGRCMEAECGADYDALLGCLDPLFAEGTCDEAMASCGVSFGG